MIKKTDISFRNVILLVEATKLIPLGLNLIPEIITCITKLFVSHTCHLRSFTAGGLASAEPRKHLHQRKVGYLLSHQRLHRFNEKTDFQFGIGKSTGLRDLLQRGFIEHEVGIDLRITACRLFQIVGQAVDRGLHRNRRHLHNGWLRRSRNGKMTQRKEYRQGE